MSLPGHEWLNHFETIAYWGSQLQIEREAIRKWRITVVE
jgi:hypothetical protein